MKFQGHLFFVLALVFLIQACGLKNELAETSTYNFLKNYTGITPDFKFYHSSDDTTEIHIKVKSSDLLYAKKANSGTFSCNVQLKAFLSDESNSYQDTLVFYITDEAESLTSKTLYKSFSFGLPANSKYDVSLEFTDLNRKLDINTEQIIDKSNDFCHENFLIYYNSSSFPEFGTYCKADFPVTIMSDRLDLSTLEISSREADLGLPPPPYSSTKVLTPEIEDFSSFDVEKTENAVILLNPSVLDLYLSNSNSGVTFLFRPNLFPELSTTSELILPVRYISAKREFEKISSGTDSKKKLDEFWLECGSNKDRAKELISAYYSRVEYANKKFSSFKSGWRTDRGLIHIIFGYPNEIKNIGNSEIWIYGDRSSLGSVEFKFDLVENKFSRNHYVLERNPIYKSEWARRVNSWRNGRIYD